MAHVIEMIPKIILRVALLVILLAPTYGQQQAPGILVPSSLFGLHMHRATSTTAWPSVPFYSWRLWDTRATWGHISKGRRKYDFSELDKQIALAEQYHKKVLYTFGVTPGWAAARPADKSPYGANVSSSEPKDIADWQDFVAVLVSRYKGRIEAYEIWNEPNLSHFYSGDIPHLVEMARVGYQTIKSIDPSALIVSPSPTAGEAGSIWLNEYLRSGGGKYADIIGFHFYVSPDPPERIVDIVRSVRSVMEANGVANKPLWNTETGWFKPKPFPPDLQRAYVPRAMLVSWANGISRFYWFAWDNEVMGLQFITPETKTLTPAGQAYGEIQKWLVGAKMGSCAPDSSATWICELNRDGSAQKVLWRVSSSLSFKIPKTWHVSTVRHIDGTSSKISGSAINISAEPVLLLH